MHRIATAFAAVLIILMSAGCDPCTDYCSLACDCADDTSDACVDTCLDTINVYSGDLRTAECADRQDALEQTCTQEGS